MKIVFSFFVTWDPETKERISYILNISYGRHEKINDSFHFTSFVSFYSYKKVLYVVSLIFERFISLFECAPIYFVIREISA